MGMGMERSWCYTSNRGLYRKNYSMACCGFAIALETFVVVHVLKLNFSLKLPGH